METIDGIKAKDWVKFETGISVTSFNEKHEKAVPFTPVYWKRVYIVKEVVSKYSVKLVGVYGDVQGAMLKIIPENERDYIGFIKLFGAPIDDVMHFFKEKHYEIPNK